MTNPNAPSKGASLNEWLSWIEATHPSDIELGVERAAGVAERAGLNPIQIPIITVAGTNGKGSTVAMLDAIYQAAGYKTGVYTSPHIVEFNERVGLSGVPASDEQLVTAFEVVENARGNTALTYFEFSTLAAMQAFKSAECDVILLEVGLGGRLDTTNVWDTQCAIVTSIAIDHESWLGNDRATIGKEKVGIGRAGVPIIMGEQNPPQLVLNHVESAGMQLIQVPPASLRTPLELSLPGEHQQSNAHAALLAVGQLQSRLPVKLAAAIDAAAKVRVAGRFEQHTHDGVTTVLDVAHNPAAAASVVSAFNDRFPSAPVFAVFGALNDKDISGVVSELSSLVQHWHCVSLDGARGTPAEELRTLISASGNEATAHSSMSDAWQAACQQAKAYNSANPTPESIVLVAGSFFTLTALHEHWRNVGRPTR